MKFSKEARIGLMVAISILVFFAGFYFLKGSSILHKEYTYYAYYDKVNGLQLSAPVQIKGFTVGKVTKIELENNTKLKVTMIVNKDTRFPANTVARLASQGLITGGQAISLDLGTSSEIAQDEAVLAATAENGLMDNISSEITPLLTDVRHAVGVVDSILQTVHVLLSEDVRMKLQHAVGSLDRTMTNFESVSGKLNAQGDALAGAIRNANSITQNLASNNEKIDRIITNLDKTADGLSRAPIEKTVNNLQQVSDELDGVIKKINNGEGSIGKAVNDPALYNELNNTLTNLKKLIADINAHPSRYINVTIFGRKAKVGTDPQ